MGRAVVFTLLLCAVAVSANSGRLSKLHGRQVPCPQAGDPHAGPRAVLPPQVLSGPGSPADLAGAIERANTPIAGAPSATARAAAAAIVAPMTPFIMNSTDCLGALLTYEFTLALRPDLSPNLDAFHSLRLDLDCGAPPPPAPATTLAAGEASLRPWSAERIAVECGTAAVFVASSGGSDGAAGTLAAPLASIHAAVAVTRSARVRSTSPPSRACIVLRGGVHYLSGRTVHLAAADSGTAFVSLLGDDPAWVSGGVALIGLGPWQPHDVSPTSNIWVATVPTTIPLTSMTGGINTLAPYTRLTNSQFPNYDIETQDGEVPGPWGGGGAVSEWIKPGLYPRPTVYWQSLAGLKNDSTMDCYNHFSTGSGGACAHWKGKGSDQAYYCGNCSDGGWVEVDALMESHGIMLYPLGMIYNTSFVPNLDSWNLPILSNPKDWSNAPTLTVWQGSPGGGGGWYNNRFAIISHDPATHYLNLTADGVWPSGGWQGGRTWHTLDAPQGGHKGPLIGGDWHVNGVFQELDYPGEYFFDPVQRLLYFYYNSSVLPPGQPPLQPGSPPPASLELIASTLEVLFNMSGTPDKPVSDVVFAGIGFRDQRDAMLEDWVAPSGGDWALRRAGAIFAEGTVRLTVTGCAFVRINANAVHLDGYNRNATVELSEFAWTGMSAVTMLGDCDQYDCTGAMQPLGTLLYGNIVRELGLVEKQSSAFFLGKSALARVEGCVFFNGPRAMINFNDNAGGGSRVEWNAIWNTCRQSGDHGPMNSWDRMALATRIRNAGVGEASFSAAYTVTSHNLIIANYGGSQAFDNDDGSSWYHTHDNFFLSADGFKMDYGGHDSESHDNVVVVRVYDGQSCSNAGDWVPGHEDRVYNNTCILPPTGSNGKDSELVSPNMGSNPDPCGGAPWGSGALIAYSNRYYTLNGNASTRCGDGTETPIVDVPPPLEAGSSAHTLPPPAQIIAWGREKIGM